MAGVEPSGGEQTAEDRLVEAELLLDGLGRQPDLPAGLALALLRLASGDQAELDAVAAR